MAWDVIDAFLRRGRDVTLIACITEKDFAMPREVVKLQALHKYPSRISVLFPPFGLIQRGVCPP